MATAGDCAGFESYLRGSWWDVQIREQRSAMYLVSYKAAKDEEWAWLPMTELRLSSRRADGWDCYFLKKGMDVSVLCKHPHSGNLNLKNEGLYDARLSSVTRAIHAPGDCSCKFAVQYFCVKMDTYTDGSLLDRTLLTNDPETEVFISNIRILQQPAELIPLQEVLEAHLDRKWIPLGRVSKDAYFLTETELSTLKKPRRVCVHEQEDTGPTNVRSDEVLSPSAARMSAQNGDKESNCNSPIDGPEICVPGFRQSPDTVEEDYRVPKSLSDSLDNPKGKHSPAYANEKSPPSINIKEKCVSGQDQKGDHSNCLVDEETPKKKRGRPRKGMHDTTGKKENGMPGKVASGMDGDLINRCKEKKGYTEDQKIDLECSASPDVSSSADSDSEGEWKPLKDLRNYPKHSYNIRTRDHAGPHQGNAEDAELNKRKGKGSAQRTSGKPLSGKKYQYSINTQERQGRLASHIYYPRNPSGEIFPPVYNIERTSEDDCWK